MLILIFSYPDSGKIYLVFSSEIMSNDKALNNNLIYMFLNPT